VSTACWWKVSFTPICFTPEEGATCALRIWGQLFARVIGGWRKSEICLTVLCRFLEAKYSACSNHDRSLTREMMLMFSRFCCASYLGQTSNRIFHLNMIYLHMINVCMSYRVGTVLCVQ
jgi:hypothetical protein